MFYRIIYACSNIILSATNAINSPLVGFSAPIYARTPKIELILSILPLFHATSIAWRIARSTLEAEVLYFSPIDGYNFLVMLFIEKL